METLQVDAVQARRVFAEADCLYNSAQVDAALDRLALNIGARLGASNPLLLCILSGGIVPMGQLLPRLGFPLRIDCLDASRYADTTRGGDLRWRLFPRTSLKDQVVLLLDDVLDAGITLAAIQAYCREQGAARVYSAVLVSKQRPREAEVQVDFVGLEAEDRYLFGMGMDYHGYWRNAPGIYAVKGL